MDAEGFIKDLDKPEEYKKIRFNLTKANKQ